MSKWFFNTTVINFRKLARAQILIVLFKKIKLTLFENYLALKENIHHYNSSISERVVLFQANGLIRMEGTPIKWHVFAV
jgi:hypothetical protein